MEPASPSGAPRHRVLVLEDDPATATELRALLDTSQDFDCRAVCATVEAAVERVRSLKPTAALVDLRLQGQFRPDAVREIKRASPRTTVLVLTAYEEPELLFRALRAGADGYLLKSDATRPLLDALRSALVDIPPFSPRVARHILRHFQAEGSAAERSGLASLTARQMQVLRRVHQGFSNPEIARELDVSADAVKMHVREILRRLHVETRVEAAAVYERFRRPPGFA